MANRNDYRTKYKDMTLEEWFEREEWTLNQSLRYLSDDTIRYYMRENSYVRQQIEKKTRMSFEEAKEMYFKK